MQNTLTKTGLNKSVLQLIAAIAMVIDHTAVFVPNFYLYYAMRFVGRITIIIMCWFIAEGYHKTRNIKNYIIRLGIFSAISQIPYYLMVSRGHFPDGIWAMLRAVGTNVNVIFTLFVGLCLLAVMKSQTSAAVKIVSAIIAMVLVDYSDWGYSAVLWIVAFGMAYGDARWQKLWLCVILGIRIVFMCTDITAEILQTGQLMYTTLFGFLAAFGGFLALPLISAYNGERGNAPKWLFYVFYPAHMLIVAVAYMIIFK